MKKRLSKPEILKKVAKVTKYSLSHVYNVNCGRRHNKLIASSIRDISSLNKNKTKILQPKSKKR